MKLVHLVGFITKKFVTMHGHMNVNFLLSFKKISRNTDLISIHGFMFDVSVVTGFGNNTVISISKTMKFTGIRKNRDENGYRAEIFMGRIYTQNIRKVNSLV